MTDHAHLALIVEDDPVTAGTLAAYAISLGHRTRVVGTLEEVEQAIAEATYCYVLLDKEIPVNGSVLPYSVTGDTALRILRRVEPRRNKDDAHIFPILVVTRFSSHPSFVAKNFQLGASAFLAKPVEPETLTQEVLDALRRANRASHAECAPFQVPAAVGEGIRGPEPVAAPGQAIVLCLDGVRIGRRTSFLVNGKRRDLQDLRFAVLLLLAAERRRASDAYLPAHVLGVQRSPEIVSRICQAVDGAVPAGFQLIQKGESGARRLHPLVVVDHIDWAVFERHPHPGIQRVAAAERKRK